MVRVGEGVVTLLFLLVKYAFLGTTPCDRGVGRLLIHLSSLVTRGGAFTVLGRTGVTRLRGLQGSIHALRREC